MIIQGCKRKPGRVARQQKEYLIIAAMSMLQKLTRQQTVATLSLNVFHQHITDLFEHELLLITTAHVFE